MKLSQFVTPELMIIKEKANSWDEIVQDVLDNMEKEQVLSLPKEDIFEALKKRENLSSTTFEKGLAVPHAKIGSPTELSAGIVLLKEPFEDGTNRPIKLMAVIVTAKQTADLYLGALVGFSSFLQLPDMDEKLAGVNTKEELYQLFVDSNLELETTLKAKHIMQRKFISCQADQYLNTVIEQFVKGQVAYCPVVDEEGKFIGEIRLRNILGIAIPDYAKRLGGLKFLTTFEPFNQFTQLKNSLKVKDVMEACTDHFSDETPVIELAFTMTVKHLNNIPIVDNTDKLIGFVGVNEIINKVLLDY